MPDGTLQPCGYDGCDEVFAAQWGKVYHSRSCKEKAKEQRARSRKRRERQTFERTCSWCDRPMEAGYGQQRYHPGCAWASNRRNVALAQAGTDRTLPLDLRWCLIAPGSTRDSARYLRAVKYGDPCAYCGGPAGSLDHIDPNVPRGGFDDEAGNVTACCRECNSVKQRTPLLLHLLADRIREDMRPLARELAAAQGAADDPTVWVRRHNGRVRIRSRPETRAKG